MDDFDTSLLFPDVIMEVENDPITTRNESNLPGASDQTSSPFDFNITGCKAQFELTEEEDQLRKKTFTIDNPVQNSKIHCTACNTHLGSALNNLRYVYVHPLLLVIICNECFDFYSSDCFEQDEDGSEMFCRWCGQGGQVICCSSCPMVFCKLCIRINFGAAKYAEIRDKDEWKCFVCEPDQTTALRVHCFEFAAYVRKEISRLASAENESCAMETDHTRCCLPTVIPNRRRTRVEDPDYVPSGTTAPGRDQKAEYMNDLKKLFEQEVADAKAESDAVQGQSAPLARTVVENDHSYCRPLGKQMSTNKPLVENPTTSKDSWSLPKPTDSKVPKLQLLPSAGTSSTGSVQFLLKQRSGPQIQTQQVATSSTTNEPTGPPAPLLIVTNFHSNSNVKLGVLKNGQRVILTPIGSIKNKPENASNTLVGSSIVQFGQRTPVAEESTQTVRENSRKVPTAPSKLQFGHKVRNEVNQQEENKSKAKPAAAAAQQLRKLPSFIVQAKKVPAQSVPEHQEDLQTKLKLADKVIRESSLANGSFGSTIIEVQRTFATAKFAQDFVTIHNTLQESLSTVLVRLLQANKELNDGFNDRTDGGTPQKATLQFQNLKPTCCPMGSNNCLRLLKYLGQDSQSSFQKSQTGGNPE